MFAILPSSIESSLRGSSGSSRRYRRGHHHTKPDLYCQFCQRRFSKSYNLMVHERSHFEINTNYTCDVCGKSYKNRDQLRQHRSQHSPGGSSNGSGSSGYTSSSSGYY